ncbi:TCFL5 protein, partial [Todus mexicanus]|nr:TCFL5 protein [Todus mexicanus]
PPSTASVPDPARPVAGGPGGSSDVSFGEQNLSFATADVSLVELMEIEYTQLQHILHSHTEVQAGGGEVEARLSSFSLPGNSADPSVHQTPLNTSQEGCSSNSSGNQSVYPVICQSGLPSDGSLLSSNPRLGCADFQELRMMLLSECNLPLNQTDRTPDSGSVEVPGHSLVKVKHDENSGGANKGNILVENSALAPEPRPKSAVRVRLEDRFNSIQTENPRCQEPRESGVTLNNLVTLIRQPSELVGVPLHQQENKCPAFGKNKTAPATPALQFTYPLFAMNACAAAGSANPVQVQVGEGFTTGVLCSFQMLTVLTCQGSGHSKSLFSSFPLLFFQEDTLCKPAINRRSSSRITPLDANTDRKPLGEIQNLRADCQGSVSAQGSWQAAQPSSSMHVPSGSQDGIAQRRERHNRLERDRRRVPGGVAMQKLSVCSCRRRIRACCDELNLLVPFCTVDTDKATTLQWTTAFLKYIQERHGDSLKQEFETVFCGKTGRRLKIASSDSFVTCPVQENTHGYGDQV